MKLIVLDTMKYRNSILIFLLFLSIACFAQYELEREHRILESQFPNKALIFVKEKAVSAKRLRYYKEIDSTQKTYSAKFKKDRLYYRMDFDEKGNLKDIGFIVKKIDIPEDSYSNIQLYLTHHIQQSKIKKILQLYSINDNKNPRETLKNTFQNLLLPSNLYKLTVIGKNEGKRQEYNITFDAEGTFKQMSLSLPSNYDHVLY